MDENWIEKAIKKPGSLTAFAKKQGGITKSGTIKRDFLEKEIKTGTPLIKKKANLAKTLETFKKK